MPRRSTVSMSLPTARMKRRIASSKGRQSPGSDVTNAMNATAQSTAVFAARMSPLRVVTTLR